MPITIVLYCFYLLLILHLLLVVRKSFVIILHDDRTENQKENAFSIIVASHNEAKNLQELIPLLLRQHYLHFEVIVALDRCTDHSLEVASSFADIRLRVLEIQTIPERFHGKKYAIEKAVTAARHEWILLTDADCRPDTQHWITSFNEKADEPTEIILGISPYPISAGLLNALICYETFQTAFNYISSAIAGNPYMGVGRNLAYRKTLFLSSGGFGKIRHITGGDDDLFVQSQANRHNTRVNLNRESLTYSAPKRTWKEYLLQKTRHLSVGKHYRSEIRWMHFLNMSIHLLLWWSFLSLIFISSDQWRIIGVFSLLLMVKGFFFTKIAKKTGIKYSVLWYPFVDFLFATIIPLIGVRAFFVKNIKWS